MKPRHLLIGMISLTALTSCMSLQKCPIKQGTTKIVYSEYANSGVATSTTFQILEDSLVWEYRDRRNDRQLRDVSHYSKADYHELVDSLSTIKFSAHYPDSPDSGGEGWGYAFYNEKGHYFHFNSESKLTGDYQQAATLIQRFVQQHMPSQKKEKSPLD